MTTPTVTRKDFQALWRDLPEPFRATHPAPAGDDLEEVAAWITAVRTDAENALVAILDASILYLARGETAAGKETADAARPFRRIRDALDSLAITRATPTTTACTAELEVDSDPKRRPCDECGAEAGEECRPFCIAQD